MDAIGCTGSQAPRLREPTAPEGRLTQVHPPGALGTAPLHVFVNFTAGVHGSILDPTSSPAATVEMQTEAIAFALTGGTQLPVSATAPVQ